MIDLSTCPVLTHEPWEEEDVLVAMDWALQYGYERAEAWLFLLGLREPKRLWSPLWVECYSPYGSSLCQLFLQGKSAHTRLMSFADGGSLYVKTHPADVASAPIATFIRLCMLHNIDPLDVLRGHSLFADGYITEATVLARAPVTGLAAWSGRSRYAHPRYDLDAAITMVSDCQTLLQENNEELVRLNELVAWEALGHEFFVVRNALASRNPNITRWRTPALTEAARDFGPFTLVWEDGVWYGKST